MNRILLIDDDPDEAQLFEEAVSAVDRTAIFNYFSSCIEALKALRKMILPLPNFIFLDINMPGLNGFECLKELKMADFLKQIPVIMYSTSGSQHEVSEAINLGALAFWAKPNRYHDLIQKLKDLTK